MTEFVKRLPKYIPEPPKKYTIFKLLRNVGLLESKKLFRKFYKENFITIDGVHYHFMRPLERVYPSSVLVNGEPIEWADPLHIIVNKPKGTTDVKQFLPKQFLRRDPNFIIPRMLPEDQCGLVLLTESYDLFKRSTSVGNPVKRVYEVICRDAYTGLEEEALQLIRGDVKPSLRKTLPKLKFEVVDPGKHIARLTLYDYKPDRVYEMLMAIRHVPLTIRRIQWGNYKMEGLAEGDWKSLEYEELEQLFPRKEKKRKVVKSKVIEHGESIKQAYLVDKKLQQKIAEMFESDFAAFTKSVDKKIKSLPELSNDFDMEEEFETVDRIEEEDEFEERKMINKKFKP